MGRSYWTSEDPNPKCLLNFNKVWVWSSSHFFFFFNMDHIWIFDNEKSPTPIFFWRINYPFILKIRIYNMNCIVLCKIYFLVFNNHYIIDLENFHQKINNNIIYTLIFYYFLVYYQIWNYMRKLIAASYHLCFSGTVLYLILLRLFLDV